MDYKKLTKSTSKLQKLYICNVKRLISFFFILLVFFSCENDLDINADWEDIPVIYSILDSGSSYEDNTEHYIKVQKSFLGDLSASQMAQETDSIYYNTGDIQLWIEKLENGEDCLQMINHQFKNSL